MAIDAILTLEELKDHLGISGIGRDARLNPIVSGIEGFIRERTARDWQKLVRTDEKYRGNGTDVLALANYPASLLTKVLIDTTALDTTDEKIVYLDGPRGQLVRTEGGGWPVHAHGRPWITVSYTGGKDPTPSLKMAALELAAWVHQATGGRTGISSGGVTIGLMGEALSELPTAADILDSHTDWARRAGGVLT